MIASSQSLYTRVVTIMSDDVDDNSTYSVGEAVQLIESLHVSGEDLLQQQQETRGRMLHETDESVVSVSHATSVLARFYNREFQQYEQVENMEIIQERDTQAEQEEKTMEQDEGLFGMNAPSDDTDQGDDIVGDDETGDEIENELDDEFDDELDDEDDDELDDADDDELDDEDDDELAKTYYGEDESSDDNKSQRANILKKAARGIRKIGKKAKAKVRSVMKTKKVRE